MSDKKRRDITLGEMQDECKRVDRKCEKCDRRISVVCGSMVNSNGYFETPKDWDLTDPPRFNEAQMALLKAFYENGARSVRLGHDVDAIDCVYFYSSANPTERKQQIGHVKDQSLFDALNYGCGETLELAELLGKDGEK